MSMHINLSPEMESFIKAKVSGGFYGNATEVIRDAVRRMQSEEARAAQFAAAVAKGEAQLRERRSTKHSRKLSEDILREGLTRAKARKPITNPDVLP